MPGSNTNVELDLSAPEERPWMPTERNADVIQLDKSVQETYEKLDKLKAQYPLIWHYGFEIMDYVKWIVSLTEIPNPTIQHLTILCLAVRALVGRAEFQFNSSFHLGVTETLPESFVTEIPRHAIPAVQAAYDYIARRRGLDVEQEITRQIYADHTRIHLQMLKDLVDPASTYKMKLKTLAASREKMKVA